MKRILIGLLCVCMLLSGCGIGSSEPLQTEPPAAETQPTEVSRIPLLEQGIALEESSNVRYIPNQEVESMVSPEVRLLGNGLLLSEYGEDGMVLKHISLEDGTLVSECVVTAKPDMKVYIGSGQIGLCDRGAGQILILDEAFQLRRNYELPREGDDWYLNSELDTLYIFFADRGLLARNLESGEELWLIDNGFCVTPIGSTNGYVIFEYTDRADQKTYTRCLNLSTATMETLPVGGSVSVGARQGETWLLHSGETDGLHMLVRNDTVDSFYWDGSAVRLLAQKRYLLATDPSGRTLNLYEIDGSFVSQCVLPMSSHAVVGPDFVWSGYWEGYFFTDFMDSSCRLMFWDVHAATEGEDLQMQPVGEAEQSQPVVEASLYERAAQLSQRFGVDIHIAEQCSLDYSTYNTYQLTDPFFIRSALDILEQAMSQYPEGFFRQLTYGSVSSIRIELVGGLTRKEGIGNHPSSVNGFAQKSGSYNLVVLDGFMMNERTIFHEFSHLIDYRLEWDSLIREDALYSEEAWLALQPEGFHYAMSYSDVPEDVLRYMESGYFISEYALTYPTEDRAVLLASAMENYSWDFEPGSGRSAKLRYYADCIRDCFDTEGWPETAVWEQVLQ